MTETTNKTMRVNRIQNGKLVLFLLSLSLFVFLIVLIESASCFAGSIMYISNKEEASIEYKKLMMVCDYYGIKHERLTVDKIKYIGRDRDQKNEMEAYVIGSDVIQDVQVNEFISKLTKEKKKISVLIAGLNPENKGESLRIWTEDSLIGIKKANLTGNNYHYKFANRQDLCRELSGQNIRITNDNQKEIFWLEIKEKSDIEWLISIENNLEQRGYPVFVRYRKGGRELFLTTGINNLTDSNNRTYLESCEGNIYLQKCFLESAPLFMFVRFVFGDECWHGISDYANLTIDDPRLIEKYGRLDFEALIKEMERSGFHTTIGFIPWNYDRNSKHVIELISKNKEKISIAVHGNNHDHREFNYYDKDMIQKKDKETYRQQERNIRQAVARMEEFKRLTELSYDKIFIFPHDISSEPTLGILKKYDFVATVNSSNIPWKSEKKEDPIGRFRVVTRKYEDFPSFKRRPASNKLIDDYMSSILIDLFLDNPILLSTHSKFFNEGIDAFNETAAFINRIQTKIRWVSLGEIADHAYLLKKKTEKNYEVISFVDSFALINDQRTTMSYDIKVPISDKSKIKDVKIDGKKIDYTASDGGILFNIIIDPGNKKRINVEYSDRIENNDIKISKEGIRIFLLRWLSEFRDMHLEKWKVGSNLVKRYYDLGIFKYGLWSITSIIVLFILINTIAVYIIIKRRSEKRGNRVSGKS